jgi:hypothetical protein
MTKTKRQPKRKPEVSETERYTNERDEIMLKKDMIPAKQAAKIAHRPLRTIYSWVRDGKLASEKDGLYLYVSLAGLRKLSPVAASETL